MKKAIVLGLLLLGFGLLYSCAAVPQTSELLVEPLVTPIERQAVLPTATAPAALPAQFPPAALAARQALSELLGVKAEEIEIRSVEPAEWPDGCLGLAAPDEMCTMAIVPGYRVSLVSGASQFTYRTDMSGDSVRSETDVSFAPLRKEDRPLAAWQNPECTEFAMLLPNGLSFGTCSGPYTVSPWAEGSIPAPMLEFLEDFAPFEAETPVGKLLFEGRGTKIASPARQRAIAEWMKIQFLAAQSGRTEADWGLALAYSRQGGFAGFCDEMKVYLDGSVFLSSCKDVAVDFRLNDEQLQLLYTWYDGLEKINYSYTEPTIADAMSTQLTMPAQGSAAADEATLNDLLAFCAELIQQARAGQ